MLLFSRSSNFFWCAFKAFKSRSKQWTRWIKGFYRLCITCSSNDPEIYSCDVLPTSKQKISVNKGSKLSLWFMQLTEVKQALQFDVWRVLSSTIWIHDLLRALFLALLKSGRKLFLKVIDFVLSRPRTQSFVVEFFNQLFHLDMNLV